MVSIGRTGASLSSFTNGTGGGEIVSFDCTQVVNLYVKQHGKNFDVVVLSTWAGESTQGVTPSPKLTILKSRDSLPVIIPVSATPGYHGNNKYRQFWSIKVALEELSSLDIDLAVKVRTDNLVDASELLKYVSSDFSKLWFPKVNDQNNYLEDFYIGGSVQNLNLLCDAALNTRSLYKSVHLDLFYGYLRSVLDKNSYSIFDFFPKEGAWTQEQANLVQTANGLYFEYFPKSIWFNQVWRGVQVSSLNETMKENLPTRPTKVLESYRKSWSHFDGAALAYYLLGDNLGSKLRAIFDNTIRAFWVIASMFVKFAKAVWPKR
jgi:hypothetical protein